MSTSEDEGVLILAPIGRDAQLAADVLAQANITSRPCRDAMELCRGIHSGAGCALITEESLTVSGLQAIADELGQQPPWSDFPLILFSGGNSMRRLSAEALNRLGNVTIVQRPVYLRTLLSAVQSALRGRRRQYAARRAIVQRDQFLAMLGHELRNPLGAIVLSAEMMKQPPDPDFISRQRVVIERQALQLSRLVDDLLDVSRFTSGKVVLQRRSLDLNAVVTSSVQAVTELLKTRAQALLVTLAPRPILVNGDPARLEQILTNLLTNAAKYTPSDGKIAVEVGFEDGQATVRVRDSGEGIEPGMLETIFELFAQAPASLGRAQGGLGLGLSLVRNLVTLHGGTVSAASPGLGKGSTFTVRLPAEVAVAPPPPLPSPPPPKSASPVAPAPLRIVVVDDNDDLRDMLQAVLKASGHHVTVAADGQSGVAKILAERPEVAIIDVGLPGIDGYEVARQVRAALAGQPLLLIALTGYGLPEHRARTREAGFDVHLTKPVATNTLRSVLTQHQAARANKPSP